jgi:hypothetical protein
VASFFTIAEDALGSDDLLQLDELRLDLPMLKLLGLLDELVEVLDFLSQRKRVD